MLQYWYEFHATHHGNQIRNQQRLIWPSSYFFGAVNFLSNNDSDWHHHWCRFCNGHSATCLVRIQNYREWGPPFSSNSQRHSGACALSFCRCILSVRLPLNYVSTVTFFTPSLLQCYQSCHTPLKYVFSPTCETQVFCWTYLSFYSTTW